MFDKDQDAYRALRAIVSERTQAIVAWVGSGLSVPAGLPTWPALRRALERAAALKIGTFAVPDRPKLEARLKQAKDATNPWLAFQFLEDLLGPTTFRDLVKEALTPPKNQTVPDLYRKLWQLRVSGMLSLNLDRLGTRSYTELNHGRIVHEFVGRDAGGYLHLLKSPDPFVVNLHGVVEDAQGWVLTNRSLRALLEDPGYVQFINSTLASRTVLFIGLTADDVAAGGHLQRLTTVGIDAGTHYWVTSRTDYDTDHWAETAGLRVIRYNAPGNNHSELSEFLSDLFTYVGSDVPAPPVTPTIKIPATPLPDPDEILSRTAEEIRLILTARAADILNSDSPNRYAEYTVFADRYDQAIYRAWYVTTNEPANMLMGYRLGSEVGRGAFGRVFAAVSPKGEEVAIKVMHEDVRRKAGMLESFRRGVRSMRILSERHVSGMVPYHEAAEIPAFAVMELIHGPDLKVAVQSGFIEDWPTILRVALDLTRIVRTGHLLPERVLHRDIRPSNIMLKGYYVDPTDWQVVVLDFDLSWHRGALEDSVVGVGAAYGYLAPEQLVPIAGVSTRNAAVDSFGLGMTLLFLCRGTDPGPGEHQSATWAETVTRDLNRRPASEWLSLPTRLARLIVNATKHSQNERWDMGQIERELQRLHETVNNSATVNSAELWSEEIAARSDIARSYTWDQDALTATARLASGIEISLRGRETVRLVELRIGWSSFGAEDRKKLGRYIGKAADQAAAALRRGGWDVDTPDTTAQSLFVSARVQIEQLRGPSADTASSAIRAAADSLRFT
jgi:serine/threonine protein kinase